MYGKWAHMKSDFDERSITLSGWPELMRGDFDERASQSRGKIGRRIASRETHDSIFIYIPILTAFDQAVYGESEYDLTSSSYSSGLMREYWIFLQMATTMPVMEST